MKWIAKNEKLICVRCVLAHQSAYLLNDDPETAFEIFQETLEDNSQLIKESFWSADYFSKQFFERMKDLLCESNNMTLDKNEAKALAITLAKAWVTIRKIVNLYSLTC
ncbi:MAG: hypothetical protein WDN26_06865 [Chitinophagaceae bacterium]